MISFHKQACIPPCCGEVKLYIQRRYKQGDYSHLPISKKGFLKEGGFLKVLTAPQRRPLTDVDSEGEPSPHSGMEGKIRRRLGDRQWICCQRLQEQAAAGRPEGKEE